VQVHNSSDYNPGIYFFFNPNKANNPPLIWQIIAKILRRRIERKIEDVLGEDQFGFRRGKGTRDAIGMV
jgi:hypothetical protein